MRRFQTFRKKPPIPRGGEALASALLAALALVSGRSGVGKLPLPLRPVRFDMKDLLLFARVAGASL
jgi:hypothetical protein